MADITEDLDVLDDKNEPPLEEIFSGSPVDAFGLAERASVCDARDKYITNEWESSKRRKMDYSENLISAPSSSFSEDNVMLCTDEKSPSIETVTSDLGSNMKYYGISFPTNVTTKYRGPLVLAKFTDVLLIVKRFHGARFLQTTSFKKALEFASKSTLVKISSKTDLTNFTLQELVDAVIDGDAIIFYKIAMLNPSYLINSDSDLPNTLTDERHNALHIAVINRHTNLCVIILNLLHDSEFLSSLYPEESLLSIEEHKNHIIDGYLNLPELELKKSPLALAVHYGFDDVVSILLSYTESPIGMRQEYNSPVEELISSGQGSLYSQRRMLSLFLDNFYVPLIRDTRCIQEPTVGEPCTKNTVLRCILSNCAVTENQFSYCAFIGPMTKDIANKVYMAIKSKNYQSLMTISEKEKKRFREAIRFNFEKGLEKVSREIAKKLKIEWIEYWKFLNFWGDVASSSGLGFLDSYLKYQSEKMLNPPSPAKMELKCEDFMKLVVDFIDRIIRKAPGILKERETVPFFIAFQDLLHHDFCKVSLSNVQIYDSLHEEMGQLLYLKFYKISKGYLNDFRHFVWQQLNIFKWYKIGNDKWNIILCIMNFFCYNHTAFGVDSPVCSCTWDDDDSLKGCSVCFHSLVKMRLELTNDYCARKSRALPDKVIEKGDEKCLLREDSKLFSATFTEVFSALMSDKVNIDPKQHPYAFQWAYLMKKKIAALNIVMV